MGKKKAAAERAKPPDPVQGLTSVHFKADPVWVEWARAEAKRQGIGLSGMIRQAVNEYLERRGRTRPE